MRVPASLIMATLLIMFVCFFVRNSDAKQKNIVDFVFEGAEQFGRKEIDTTRTDGIKIEDAVEIDNLWDKDSEGTELWVRFVRGILRSRQKERVNDTRYIRWEVCGERVSEEDYYKLATTWALAIVDSIDQVEKETGYKANPWGAFALTANEGGFNECALDYVSRRWASHHIAKEWTIETWKGKTAGRWVEKPVVKRFSLTYDKETVWRIINHKDYAKATVEIKDRNGYLRKHRINGRFDGGPFQIRLNVKNISREKFDQLLTIRPGVYIGIKEMARRALEWKKNKHSKYPHPRVWQLWPGYVSSRRSNEYDRKITSVARWLGARKGEIANGFSSK